MKTEDWATLAGVLIAAALAIGPWMLAVHAKLAVIASRVADVCAKLEASAADQRRLWDVCARHETDLSVHAAELASLRGRPP